MTAPVTATAASATAAAAATATVTATPSTPDSRYRHVRPREHQRLVDWDVRETDSDVHFITTPDGWELALTHYRPAQRPTRCHPVLLCHGLGANRLAWDIAPKYSLPRWLLEQGFDVYALELRGHGLSEKPGAAGKPWGWGFTEYCEIDVPAALDFVLAQSGASGVHFMGHSLGGILLYGRAALADPRIRSGITLGSSLDYSGLPSMFHAVAPLAPLSHLVPQVPVHWGALFSSWASGLSPRLVDATLVCPENVELDVYRQMAANVLHPVSSRILRDMAGIIRGTGLFTSGGERYDALLRERGYAFPVLAVAGSADVQCPPATAARFGTSHLVFGKAQGQREDYGHHDLLMGRHARSEVWPRLGEWLIRHDGAAATSAAARA